MCNDERLHSNTVTPRAQLYSGRAFFLTWVQFPSLPDSPEVGLQLGGEQQGSRRKVGKEMGAEGLCLLLWVLY